MSMHPYVKVKPDKEKRLAVDVQHYILQQMVEGRLLPGARILEMEIAAELNVSQTCVREALIRLEVLDLVETQYYKGCRVREISLEEAREVHALRATVEAAAAQKSAPHFRGHVEELQHILVKLLEAGEHHDNAQFDAHDMMFRHAIVAASGSRVLLREWQSLLWKTHLTRQLKRRPRNLHTVRENYARVVEALNAGQGKRAARLLSLTALGVAQKKAEPAGILAKPSTNDWLFDLTQS